MKHAEIDLRLAVTDAAIVKDVRGDDVWKPAEEEHNGSNSGVVAQTHASNVMTYVDEGRGEGRGLIYRPVGVTRVV